MNLLFSFGDGNLALRRAAMRVARQSERFQVFDLVTALARHDLEKSFPTEVCDVAWSERGLGFWAWKPLVLLEALKQLNSQGVRLEEAVLAYVDAGCWVNFSPDSKEYLEEILDRTKREGAYLFLAGQGLTDRMYTKREVLDRFPGVSSRELDSLQIAGGIWFLRGDVASALATDWWELCSDLKLVSFDFDPSIQHPEFVVARNDQSIFSMLCKRLGYSASDDDINIHPALGEVSAMGWKYPFWASRHRSGVRSLSMSLWRRGLTAIEMLLP